MLSQARDTTRLTSTDTFGRFRLPPFPHLAILCGPVLADLLFACVFAATMYFPLIDRISELDTSRIVATKQLHPTEPYLKDHFPGFPVMPGVLMMEAAYQTCAWLLLYANEFKQDFARLQEVRNIKFGSFVQPGDILQLTANIFQRDKQQTTLQVRGAVGEQSALAGRWILAHNTPDHETIADKLIADKKQASDDYAAIESGPDVQSRNRLEEIFHKLYDPARCADSLGR